MVEAPEQPSSVAYLMKEFESLIYEMLDLFYLPHQDSKQFQDVNQLRKFESLAEVIKLLQRRRTTEDVMLGGTLHEREASLKCLQSLLFIWATLQDSEERCTEHSFKEEDNVSHALNKFLQRVRHHWAKPENEIFFTHLGGFLEEKRE